MIKEITVEEATHANQYGYSDVNPYEIVKKNTPRKMMVREMVAELDSSFVPDVSVGGFVGHFKNNHEQSYSYKSNPSHPEIAIRLDKKGNWKDKWGNKYNLSNKPHKFHDYNF
jgi:hypothetical protein